MSRETSTSLRMSRVIGESRERVFEAWTRPEHMKQWACPEHATVDDVQVDLTVRGRCACGRPKRSKPFHETPGPAPSPFL